jgi:hypothetical protein
MAEDAAVSSGFHYPEREAMQPTSNLNWTATPGAIDYDLYAGDVPEPTQDYSMPPDAVMNRNKVSRDKRKAQRKAQRQARRANR